MPLAQALRGVGTKIAPGGAVNSKRHTSSEQRTVHRRAALKGMLGASLAFGLARVGVACTADDRGILRNREPAAPTDGDEYVPGEGEAVQVPEAQLPNASWEARVKQLEAEQARLFGAVFSAAAPGLWVGKERSHVPQVASAKDGDKTKVTVTVQHVMGNNKLDAGPASADAAMDADAALDARADAALDTGTDAAKDATAEAGEGGADAAADGATDAAADASDAGKDAGDAGFDAALPDAAVASDASSPEHYITTIYLRGEYKGVDTVLALWEFSSTDAAPPAVSFELSKDIKSVVAFEWCTLHGLWQSEPVAV